MTQAASYLLAGQPTELERLQLQSRVWEPAGRALLAQLPGGQVAELSISGAECWGGCGSSVNGLARLVLAMPRRSRRFWKSRGSTKCVCAERKESRAFPSPEHFTRWVVTGSLLARTGVQVRDDSLAAIIREVDGALQPYMRADGLAFPMEAHFAVART